MANSVRFDAGVLLFVVDPMRMLLHLQRFMVKLSINFMGHQYESGFHHQPYWGNTAICSLDGERMALSTTTDRILQVGCHRHALNVN